MSRRLVRAAIAAACLVAVDAIGPRTTAAQSVSIPETPAGRTLKAWLDAINPGDSTAISAFIAKYHSQLTIQGLLQLRRGSGGFELQRILTSEPGHIEFIVKEKASPTIARGTLDVTATDPIALTAFGLRVIPAGAPLEGCKTYQPPATTTNGAASPRDVASEDAILAALYESISGPACQHRDWDRFRSLFAPGARLIPTGVNADRKATMRAQTPDEYAAAARPGLEEFGFFEHETARTGENFGAIAHAFSTYESRRTAADDKPFARGINSIQLLNDGTRWWIVTVYWQAERPDTPIPAQYLRKP